MANYRLRNKKYNMFSDETVPQIPSSVLHQVQQAEVLMADPGLIEEYALIYKLPGLKWMQGTWAG